MKQHYVSNSEESSRMFKSDFLEMFSKVHYSVPLIVFVPAISYFLYMAFTSSIGLINGVLYFLLGFGIWTITEYIMHRFVFHFVPKSKIGLRLHFIFHGVHHDYPKDLSLIHI